MTAGTLPMKEAMEMLTVGEVRTIERHYGRDLNELSGTDLTVAVVWAHERRDTLGQESRPDWAVLDDWTMKDLNGYFLPEAIDIDPTEPETDSGKELSHDV